MFWATQYPFLGWFGVLDLQVPVLSLITVRTCLSVITYLILLWMEHRQTKHSQACGGKRLCNIRTLDFLQNAWRERYVHMSHLPHDDPVYRVVRRTTWVFVRDCLVCYGAVRVVSRNDMWRWVVRPPTHIPRVSYATNTRKDDFVPKHLFSG